MMEPTNSLVICSDQHNKFITGCYGNEFVQTPNIDRLARLGTRFNSAYTPSPICMPARACLATGRYCHEIGAWGNGSPYTGTHADTGEAIPTWGHRLTEQGFDAVTVGKLHFHPDVESGYDERIPLHATLAKDGYGPAIWGWTKRLAQGLWDFLRGADLAEHGSAKPCPVKGLAPCRDVIGCFDNFWQG